MKVVLANPKGSYISSRNIGCPPLGLMIMANLIRNLANVQIVDFAAETKEKCEAVLKQGQYDLVGISSNLDSFFGAVRIARLAKEANPDALVVAGGAFATICPELHLRNNFDAVVRGEGELTFPDLIEKVSIGKPLMTIPGLIIPNHPLYHNLTPSDAYFTPTRPSLKSLNCSIPAYDLFNLEPYITKITISGMSGLRQTFVIASRGCGRTKSCSFCNAHYLSAKVIRKKSEIVAQEIQLLKDCHGIEAIYFGDANFVDSQTKIKALARHLKNIGLPWACYSRADTLKDPETLKLMRRSGCREILIGMESANPAVLEKIGKSLMPEDISNGIANCRRADIKPVVTVIVGLPGETKKSLRAMVEFLKKERVTVIPNFLYPIPGTALYWEARKARHLFSLEGLLRKIEEYNSSSREKLVFNLSAANDDVLLDTMKKLHDLNEKAL